MKTPHELRLEHLRQLAKEGRLTAELIIHQNGGADELDLNKVKFTANELKFFIDNAD